MANKFVIGITKDAEDPYHGKHFVVLFRDKHLMLTQEPFDSEDEARSWISMLKKTATKFTKVEVKL